EPGVLKGNIAPGNDEVKGQAQGNFDDSEDNMGSDMAKGMNQNVEIDSNKDDMSSNKTGSQLEANQIKTQVKEKIMPGNFETHSGKQIQLQVRENDRIQLKSGNFIAKTDLKLISEKDENENNKTKLKVELSNGKNSEIKVMPDTASVKALERLRLKVCSEDNNCTIELKEVSKGEDVRAAYEVQLEKQAKFLGIFKTKMQVQAQVDAENGEVIDSKKPWWAFLASEQNYSEEDSNEMNDTSDGEE
ncbi:MAG: hypothetical protein ACOC2U_02345, partial [bacterium]